MTQLCASGDGVPTETVICKKCTELLASSLSALAVGPRQRVRVYLLEDGGQRREVDHLQGLVADLDDTIARLTSTAVGIGVASRSAETPIPYHQAASKLGVQLRRDVLNWAQRFAAANDHLEFVAATTQDMARWMAMFPNLLAMHPEAGAMAACLLDRISEVRRMVDRRPDRVYVGPCDGAGADDVKGVEPCGSDLLAEPGLSWCRCNVCGREYHVKQRRDWLLASLEDHMGNSAYVSMVVTGLGVKVSASTIREWVRRKKLRPAYWAPPATPDGKPRPMYRVGDVVDVAAGRTVYAA